jgi:UDP-N-acetylglucosamine 2-epimerase (non-hydrolysing)
MKKVLIVFGTRPEAIKMAPLVKEFENYTDSFQTKVCVTAQHREMLDQVLDIFDITPDYDLNIMKTGQDLYDVTSNVLLGMRDVLSDFQPDVVLVHGDTTTTSTTALASYYQKIKVGHVEAGLRTNNIYSPWPEEANRRVVGSIANFHFAPTEISKQNLLNENIDEANIAITGNTVIDALLFTRDKTNKDTELLAKVTKTIQEDNYNIDENKRFILVTGHRRENFGQKFINICEGLKAIALNNPDVDIVYPVHLNPNVQQPVKEILAGIKNVFLIEPLDYEAFVYLMSKSHFIITDSGGVQEEAPSLGKPVLVMRETTERPEAVEAGTVMLVGTDKDVIASNAQKLLDDQSFYKSVSALNNPYGEGDSSKQIIEFLKENL